MHQEKNWYNRAAECVQALQGLMTEMQCKLNEMDACLGNRDGRNEVESQEMNSSCMAVTDGDSPIVKDAGITAPRYYRAHGERSDPAAAGKTER